MYNPDHIRTFVDEEAKPETIEDLLKSHWAGLHKGERFDTFVAYVTLRAFEQYHLLNRAAGMPREIALVSGGLMQIKGQQLTRASSVIMRTAQEAFTENMVEESKHDM